MNKYYDCREALVEAYDKTVHDALDRFKSKWLWCEAFELDYGMDAWFEVARRNGR